MPVTSTPQSDRDAVGPCDRAPRRARGVWRPPASRRCVCWVTFERAGRAPRGRPLAACDGGRAEQARSEDGARRSVVPRAAAARAGPGVAPARGALPRVATGAARRPLPDRSRPCRAQVKFWNHAGPPRTGWEIFGGHLCDSRIGKTPKPEIAILCNFPAVADSRAQRSPHDARASRTRACKRTRLHAHVGLGNRTRIAHIPVFGSGKALA